MEDGDDDFGDLYADVEVEASSAMNVGPQFSQLQFVSNDETGKRINALEASNEKEDRVSDGDEEEDDDDLNILLNSDDDDIRHVEGLTIARTNTNLRSGELADGDDDNFGTEEFAGGKAVGNSHSLYKYSRSQSAAYGSELTGSGCGTTTYCQRSVGPQHGQRFTLPWSRSILDVNINVFEQKPWKHPGSDITDYFNFGLNEDSWRHYCNQVDEYRHGGPMSSESPASEPAQLSEKKGMAIQVEDSIVERQSSMDMRRQLDRDSDVIQITIVDPEENCCESAKQGSDHGHLPEASKSNNEDDDDDDDETDHLSFSSASEDESFEGNQLDLEKSASKRVSNRRSSSKPVTQGSENHESHQCSDEAIRTSENTKERTGEDTCTTDPSVFLLESSEAEKSPQNHRKSFEDRWKSSSHERSSYTELTRSVKPSYHHSDAHRRHHSRRLDDKRKHGDYRYHSRCNSPPVYNTNRIRKDCKDSKPKRKSHHENDDIIWSRRKHGEHRYHARRHGNSVYNHRSYERMHPFDPYNEESIVYSRESEPPLDYYHHHHGERFSGYEDYERFGPKTGRPVFRRSEEEEYYEQRRYTDEFEWQSKRRENNMHFENKGINDEFFHDREYSNDIKGETFRYFGHNDMEKDEFEDAAYTRWEFRDYGRKKAELNHQSPESSLYGRHMRYEDQLTDRFRYDGEDYRNDYNDGADVARSGDHHWQSEMQWKDDGFMRPFEHDHGDDPYVKGRKYKFERISNLEHEESHERRFGGKRDSDVTGGGSYEWVFMGGVKSHVVDDLNANGSSGYKRKREVISGKKCRKSYGESGKKKLSLSCRNSLDSRLGVGEGKSSKKHEHEVAKKAIDGIEEGQIPTKEVNAGPTKDDTVAHVNRGNGNEKTGLDKSRILEARAKMEKRRARFNAANTTTTTNESDGKGRVVNSAQEAGSFNKPQRPARKRRWGGS